MQKATIVLLMLISYTLIKAQNPSVILELESTNQGVLAPRMTEMQRTDISPLVEGLLVYQTDGSSGFYFYNGNNWVSLSSGITEADTVNWNSKQDELTGTAPGEMLYWDGSSWVTVASGVSGQVLTFCNGVPTWGPCTFYEVASATGRVWMDRNLGATQVATSRTDTDAYGDLYQWGRGTDGHQIGTSDDTVMLSSSDMPGHGHFIRPSGTPYDWRAPQNDALWQGVSGINNPCPSGYRLPTSTEWMEEYESWISQDSAGAMASPLRLPLSGLRSLEGSLISQGITGSYWSSSNFGGISSGLNVNSDNAFLTNSLRGVGNAVRCIKEE